MFAVIQTGGKQYRVAKDDKIVVEKLAGDAGSVVELGNVLMIGEDGKEPTIGAPVVEKAAVFAEVIEQGKADKVLVFKKKRRQNYRRTKGHRQEQTVLKIVEVSPTGTKPKATAKAKAAPAKEAPAKEAKAKPADTPKKEAKVEKPVEKKAAAKKATAKKPAAKKKTEE